MKKLTILFAALCATLMAWGEDKSITETYVNASTGASSSRVSFKSSFDENFTVWQRGGRSKTTDVVSIGGKDVKGFWLSRQTSSNCYIEWGETNRQYLGGVKAISFAYKQFGNEANHTMILDIQVNGTSVDQISFPAGTSPYPTYSYSKDLNAKKLTKLTIKNSSTATEGTNVDGRFVVGPVTITPYLYCPSSAQNVQYKVSESATYINPDFIDNTEGEATWSCAPEGIVTVADGVVTPIEGKSGKVVITAKLNDIEVSYNLEVIAKSTPAISFENEAITITNLYTTDPVANALTVTEGAGEVTYTSSNPLVAEIEENKVYVVGVGEAIITATTAENDDFVSGSASYTLTVAEPTGETAVSEDFEGKLPLATSYQTEPVNFTDQDSLYFWTVNGHRYDGTWVRFATNENACMTSQGVQEGGIKRLAFTWKRANGECSQLHTTIKALDKDGNYIEERSIKMAGTDEQTSNQDYNMRFEVKQNAQFYLRNEGDGFVILISDIKIIPYLLYTKKLDDVTILAGETQATYKNEAFINNTGATPTFSIISSEPASIATIAADGTVTATAAGTIKVQAAWGDVTTTYELEVIYSKQDPELVFDPKEITVGIDETTITTPTLSNPHELTVTYFSSDEDIATVDENTGEVTLKGVTGEVTISAHSDETDMYEAGNASYTLTVMDFALWQTVRTDGVADNWNTICLERNITAIDGATFWTVSGQDANSFVLDEVTEPQAGQGYLIRFTKSDLKVKYGDQKVTEPVTASYGNPVQGTFEQIDFDPDGNNVLVGNYVVYNNKLCPVEAWVGMRGHRAYVVAGLVPNNASAPAPGRARAYMPKPDQTPTDIESVDGSQRTIRNGKFLRNGQLIIVKDNKMYNVQGMKL